MDETEQEGHMPWEDPWDGAGVPKCGFWTEERVQQADELVKDYLKTDFDRVARGGLSVEEFVEKRPARENIPVLAVTNEFGEVPSIKYDNRHLTAMATDSAIRYARGEAGD